MDLTLLSLSIKVFEFEFSSHLLVCIASFVRHFNVQLHLKFPLFFHVPYCTRVFLIVNVVLVGWLIELLAAAWLYDRC